VWLCNTFAVLLSDAKSLRFARPTKGLPRAKTTFQRFKRPWRALLVHLGRRAPNTLKGVLEPIGWNPRMGWICTYSGFHLYQVDSTYTSELLQDSLYFYSMNPNSGPLQCRPAESRLSMTHRQVQLVVAGYIFREVSHRCRQVQDHGRLKGLMFALFGSWPSMFCAVRRQFNSRQQ
jgi:hypothetical protein